MIKSVSFEDLRPESKIEFVKNAKKKGTKSGDRYHAYSQAKTVKEAFDKGALKPDLKYDLSRGFLKIGEKADLMYREKVSLWPKKREKIRSVAELTYATGISSYVPKVYRVLSPEVQCVLARAIQEETEERQKDKVSKKSNTCNSVF